MPSDDTPFSRFFLEKPRHSRMATFDVFSEYAFNIKPSEFQFKDVPLSTRNEIG